MNQTKIKGYIKMYQGKERQVAKLCYVDENGKWQEQFIKVKSYDKVSKKFIDL